MTLHNTLVVPYFQYNLLSVSKLCRDSKCLVVLSDTVCLLQDCVIRTVKGIGEYKNGLHHLVNASLEHILPELLYKGNRLLAQLYSMHNGQHTFVGIANKHAEFALWHNRLGHAPESKMKYIDSISVSSKCKEVCLTCPMAKFAKLHYEVSDSCASDCFELMHIDIWGAYKVSAREKFRYFLTIVDDHSRATWVYLLQFKSQAFSILQKFWNYVHTHFGKAIKIFRSYNAMEFDSGACETFFSNHGIVHQTSCVDKPQQNGRVERKHKHILEISRALRFQAGLHLVFWDDCVLAAVHIINRLPSSVLHNKTPFEILMKQLPAYDHLKVFGCLAMARNPSRTHDKFDPRGVPCLFVGYPSRQKAYKLLNLLTNQYFVSRDVVFQ